MTQAGTAVGEQAAHRLTSVAAAVCGLRIEAGLTDDEIGAVEQRFGFEFAADHRAFLAAGLPVGPRWPDWRRGTDADLRQLLGWPVEGVLFDVAHSRVWFDGWGPRPGSTAEAVAAARLHLAAVPQLVPVFSHRYLPSGRASAGHPVLSVHRTDVVCCGVDLADYVHREFGAGPGRAGTAPPWRPPATVAFWRDLVA